MPRPPENLRQFAALVAIIRDLRGPQGCPWDKEQTHQSLARFTLEEAAELAEALDRGEPDAIQEELGDVLLQVVLNAEIARQAGHFDIDDVIAGIGDKMVRRHPHVFGDMKAEGSQQVVANWQHLKEKEKVDRPLSAGLPPALPALIASQKIGERTKAHRFDWTRIEDVVTKVEEELNELKAALAGDSRERQMAELGDLLFSLAQLARHLGGDAEQALRITNRRFEGRFMRMRELLRAAGLDAATVPAATLEEYWNKAKQKDQP